jgi:hypothetical protein
MLCGKCVLPRLLHKRGTRSVIDYVIINDKLKSNIEDTRVFRGSEIDSNHKLMESKFKYTIHVKHYNKERDKTIHKKSCWI